MGLHGNAPWISTRAKPARPSSSPAPSPAGSAPDLAKNRSAARLPRIRRRIRPAQSPVTHGASAARHAARKSASTAPTPGPPAASTSFGPVTGNAATGVPGTPNSPASPTRTCRSETGTPSHRPPHRRATTPLHAAPRQNARKETAPSATPIAALRPPPPWTQANPATKMRRYSSPTATRPTYRKTGRACPLPRLARRRLERSQIHPARPGPQMRKSARRQFLAQAFGCPPSSHGPHCETAGSHA